MSATDHLRKSGEPAFTSWMGGNADFELYTLLCRTFKPLPIDAEMSLAWKLDRVNHIETLERLCRAEVDDGHGLKSYCGAVFATRGSLMTHVRKHHPDVKTHTREKKDAHGGKTNKSDQPVIKGYYRKFFESIRTVDPGYFKVMESLRDTMHEDYATYRAMSISGPVPSQIIAPPSQPPAITPRADVDRVSNNGKKRTTEKAPIKSKGDFKRAWENTDDDDDDDDEEFFKLEVDDQTEQIGGDTDNDGDDELFKLEIPLQTEQAGEDTVIKTEEGIKDLWAKFSHPQNASHILVESRPISVLVGDSVFQEVEYYPLIPLRNRRSSDTFDGTHIFGDGKSAASLVPKHRAMLAITKVMKLKYGEAKACDVCENSGRKGRKRAKASRCKMNSTRCRGFKQFSSTTFNVKFSEAEHAKYHQQTLAEAQKRA